MSKELFVSSTPQETKLALTEDDQLAEVYFERANEYTLAGSIYKGRVTRVLPGMQSAFVDIGLDRDAFLYVSDFLELQDEDELEDIVVSSGQQPSIAKRCKLLASTRLARILPLPSRIRKEVRAAGADAADAAVEGAVPLFRTTSSLPRHKAKPKTKSKRRRANIPLTRGRVGISGLKRDTSP